LNPGRTTYLNGSRLHGRLQIGKGVSMRGQTLKTTLTIFALCTIALSMRLAARKLAGQNAGGQVSMQAYNPYPPGILPSDLNPEIEGVRRERRMLEQRALERWHDLKPPLVRGQPPTLQNTGTEAVETLGELMNYDQNISPNKNEACSFCHMPYAGFSLCLLLPLASPPARRRPW
jgi:cytochrome c peroxidase